MTYRNILVLGGTGFVGQHLVDCLVAQGRRVCVPTRRRARGRDLLVLPTVEVVEADITDGSTLRALLADKDAVINTVGILHESSAAAPGGAATDPSAGRYGRAFAAVHVNLPRSLVAACQQAGVGRLLHISALGADVHAPSAYLRSKAEGERIVREASQMASTVFRPSVVFGPGDSFLSLFARLAAWVPVLLTPRPQSRMQPVWVRDLAGAMCTALDARATFGKGYEICGPGIYTLRELMQFAARTGGHPRPVIGLPDALAYPLAFLSELLPGPTLLSRDNLRSLGVDSVASEQPYLPAPELGMHPTPLEPEAALYLAGLHPRSRFGGFRARARR
ncbi:MAG TPA: complex I NDUFA9 subunit family protein [Burkholderiaceae bacterium]|nr:complex I NDUFA9 subunit family protein [Burkholderiaceae bacterium]